MATSTSEATSSVATTSTTQYLLDPNAAPLNDAEMAAAVPTQVLRYRQVVRTNQDPPITNQAFANMSMMLFDAPKKTKRGKNFYGFIKNRGTWITDDIADREAKRIVRDVDSKFQVRIAPVGHWVAITDDDSFVQDLVDVGSGNQKEEDEMRTQAIKDKEAERRRIMREIRDREEQCKSGDIYDDQESLKFYSMKRVTEFRLHDEIENRIKQLQSYKNSLTDTRNLLKALEAKYPQYAEQWIECYNEERKVGGVPEFVPGEHQFDDYLAYKPGPHVPFEIK